MNESLKRLMALADKVQMTSEDREKQRRSFAYGSARIENDLVTREMVDEAAEKLKPDPKQADA
jgi:hypothetical protein